MGSRAEPRAADAKGDQCGMEKYCGVWSLTVSASDLEPVLLIP